MPHPVGVPLRYRGGEQAFRCWSGRTVRRERWPAAQDAVFRRLLPMARGWPPAPSRLVGRWIRGRGNGPLKAVWPGRWRGGGPRTAPGSRCSRVITIVVELDRLSATASDRGPVIAVADRYDEPLTSHPRE